MSGASVGIVEFVESRDFLGLEVSPAQRTLLKAVYGLPLDEEELELWRACTGRAIYPGQPFPEITVLAGARAGKDSRIAVPIALYEAFISGHAERLGKGEIGVVPIVAQDQRATKVAFSYARDYVLGSPLLKKLVAEVREQELWLQNRIRLVSFACTAKSLRGWSIPAAVLDEVAFYRLEAGADADVEIQTAVRRGMVGFTGARLVKISTPYLKSGVLYEDFSRYFGQASADVLVWRAPSVLMNPTLDRGRLAREQRVDSQRFAREYEAEFAEDLEAFLPAIWLESATIEGRHELPPHAGVQYVAAVDPSGGGADAFTLCLAHREGDRIVQDVMRGWAASRGSTVDLAGVVGKITEVCRTYGVQEVLGDRYAGQWVAQEFSQAGMPYREAEVDKARAYLALEPLLAQGRVELLDHPTQLRELRLLERRARVGGKTIIDHPRGGHDDHANALALTVAALGTGAGLMGSLTELAVFGDVRRGEAPPGIAMPQDWLPTYGSATEEPGAPWDL